MENSFLPSLTILTKSLTRSIWTRFSYFLFFFLITVDEEAKNERKKSWEWNEKEYGDENLVNDLCLSTRPLLSIPGLIYGGSRVTCWDFSTYGISFPRRI